MTAVDPQPNVPPPKRRWFQYSLRSLLLLTLLCAVACSWYVEHRRVATVRKQYELTAAEFECEMITHDNLFAASKRLREVEEASYPCGPVHARARFLVRVHYMEMRAWGMTAIGVYDEAGHEEAVKQATHLTRCRIKATERLEEALENQ